MGQDLMRKKSIDPDHKHEGMQPHVHHGYEHNEDDPPRGATRLTAEEEIMAGFTGHDEKSQIVL